VEVIKTLHKLALFKIIMLDCLSTKISGGFNSFLKRSITSINYFTFLISLHFFSLFLQCFTRSLKRFPQISKPEILIFTFVLKTLSSNWLHHIDVHLCHLRTCSSTIFRHVRPRSSVGARRSMLLGRCSISLAFHLHIVS